MPVITEIEDLRRIYKRRVPKMFFDYTESGSWSEQTFRENSSDFDEIYFRQRVAKDMADRSTASRMIGQDVSMPVALGTLGPIGYLMSVLFFALALLFGVLMTLPIGGADMPVVISLYNALTGLAVAFEGFVLGNAAMIIAGTVVGSAGTLLTQLMAKAMNRSLGNVLFSGFGSGAAAQGEAAEQGEMKEIDATDAAVMMAYADTVIIVPGYGMAVAQAQHKIWELTQALRNKGVDVKFAIHPVAGRMPGHMNVLLAEANVPYDQLVEIGDQLIGRAMQSGNFMFLRKSIDFTRPRARVLIDRDRAGALCVCLQDMGQALANHRHRLRAAAKQLAAPR